MKRTLVLLERSLERPQERLLARILVSPWAPWGQLLELFPVRL
jgi:hypothetical protein